MVACGSLHVGLSQEFASSIGYLAVSRVCILTSANGELHGAVYDDRHCHVAVSVAVVALCTVEGYTCGQC